MDQSQVGSSRTSRSSASGRASREGGEGGSKSGTPSRSTQRGGTRRYKDRFNALRVEYDKANQRHDQFQQDIVKADEKLKKIQSECDLLLDALALAAPTQPSLMRFLVPPSEDPMLSQPLPHDSYAEPVWTAGPPPPHAYMGYEYERGPMERPHYELHPYANGHGEYVHDMEPDPRDREWERHRMTRVEDDSHYTAYDRSMYRPNEPGLNGHGNGSMHGHTNGQVESAYRGYYQEHTPPLSMHHANGHRHGS